MIICPKCHRQYRPIRNGVTVIESAQGHVLALWRADLLGCACKQTITLLAQRPFAESWQSEFTANLQQAEAHPDTLRWDE